MRFALNMNHLVGKVNILFFTFDSLRFDVAERTEVAGIQEFLPEGKWEKRDAPGTFTLPSHTAFFHGFFPTLPGKMATFRPLSLEFEGSTTVNENTYVFSTPNIVQGFEKLHYRTFCVGGVGFFNKKNPMGHFLPGYFQESYWSPEVGVSAPNSAKRQCEVASQWLETIPASQKFFLFINFSATHTPHGHYISKNEDSVESQMAALQSIGSPLSYLVTKVRKRGDCLCFWMSDHGDAYGEDGLVGHRFAHPTVSTIPYAEFVLPKLS